MCLMQCSYSSTFQNDSKTPEGIKLELMDRLLKKRETEREKGGMMADWTKRQRGKDLRM